MHDDNRSIALVSRNTSLVDAVAAEAGSHGLPLRHFDSVQSWFSEATSSDLSATTHVSPAWSDCLVLETDADQETGLAALRQVCEQRAGLPVIAMIRQPSFEIGVAAMRAGAMTVLKQPAPDDELGEAIRDGFHVAQQVRPRVVRFAKARRCLADLNPAEHDVLNGLLEGLANKEIAFKLEIGLRTVELRRARIMKKMRAQSLAELVCLVCEVRGFRGRM